MTLRLILGLGLVAAGLGLVSATEPPPSCKPVQHYGVKGCEPLPDQSCPAGYHKQAVEPSDPRMKGPTFLMCVPNEPPPKEQKTKPREKS